MGLLRAFLASELPTPLQDAIQTATIGLRKSLGNDLIRWVPVHNVHLTLIFLGDVSSSGLDLIKQMMTAEAAQYRAFEMQLEGLGCYRTLAGRASFGSVSPLRLLSPICSTPSRRPLPAWVTNLRNAGFPRT